MVTVDFSDNYSIFDKLRELRVFFHCGCCRCCCWFEFGRFKLFITLEAIHIKITVLNVTIAYWRSGLINCISKIIS